MATRDLCMVMNIFSVIAGEVDRFEGSIHHPGVI